jgi:hypothetical protein
VSGRGTSDAVSTKLNNHHFSLYLPYTCQKKGDQTSSSSHNDSAFYGGFKLALVDLEFFWKMMHFYEACQCTHGTPNVTCRLGQEFGHVDLVFCHKQKFMLKSSDFMLNSRSLFHVSKVDKPKKEPPLSKALSQTKLQHYNPWELKLPKENMKTTNNFNLWVLRDNISFNQIEGFVLGFDQVYK